MIDGQRHIGHWPDEDRILTADFANHDPLLELADTEDRRLTLMEDDRRCEQRSRYAVVRDGEAAAGYVGTLQFPFAGTARELVELRARLFEAQRAGFLHDRYDKALLAERRADADVDRG